MMHFWMAKSIFVATNSQIIGWTACLAYGAQLPAGESLDDIWVSVNPSDITCSKCIDYLKNLRK